MGTHAPLVATLENSNRARENPPVAALQEVIREAKRQRVVTGSSIVYWMRMQDMRSTSLAYKPKSYE